MPSFNTYLVRKPALLLVFCWMTFLSSAQNSTYSPYSRFGLGEMLEPSYVPNQAMGGAYVAFRPDSTVPCFINPGNPAAYSLIRYTTLELGGRYTYSDFRSGNSGSHKWGVNYSYASLGVPLGTRLSGVAGIMPVSYVGYDLSSVQNTDNVGNVNYLYSGSGGISKAFLGFGSMPFKKSASRYIAYLRSIPDSMFELTKGQVKRRYMLRKFISDFSVGFNACYLFGDLSQDSKVVYPNSVTYNNLYRGRNLSMSAFSGDFGFQSAFTIDSVRHKRYWKGLEEKIKIVVGYRMSLNNSFNAYYSSVAYNYILTGTGAEIIRDTVLYNVNQKTRMTLPLQQGIGIAIKKGERLNIMADAGLTQWSGFRVVYNTVPLKDNMRLALGVNYVPKKSETTRGTYLRRVQYRAGVSYSTGYVQLNGQTISDAAFTIGFGLPVGIIYNASMVNVSLRVGQMGTTANDLVRERYVRISFGFTYCDKWFNKYRED